MFHLFDKHYELSLARTPIRELKANSIVNLAGIVSKSIEPPRRTSYKDLYIFVSLQGNHRKCLPRLSILFFSYF